jgi:uncharacterized protein YndB with AHSA1/START domain
MACRLPLMTSAYARRIALAASRDQAFDAIASLDGLRGWWTAIVGGDTAPGGELRFGFEGLDEHIVMRVDAGERPATVRWTCLAHTSSPAWDGTHVTFALLDDGPDRCTLSFRHEGIAPDLVAPGWERFLASLAALVARGQGHPFHHAAAA